MSEHVTHLAVAYDCRRLLLASGATDDAVRRVLEDHHEAVRLGSITRGGADFMVHLLDAFREDPDGDPDPAAGKRLAFVLGWYAHRAADRYFKLVYRQLDPDPVPVHNVRIYHDLVTFREVYDDGDVAPFVPGFLEPAMGSHPASGAVDVERAEPLFRGKYLRDLLELHSFVDDDEDFEGWLDRVFAARQYDRMDHVTAYASPDPATMERVIDAPNFYDPDDPIVALARSIARGEPDPSIDFDDAVAAAVTGSQYARALNLGIAYLRAANDYVAGDIGRDDLEYRIELAPMSLFEGEFDHETPERPPTRLDHPDAGEVSPAGRLAPIAVADDCRRLAGWSNEVADPIVASLDRHPDAARLGGAVRSPSERLPPVLERYRDRWPAADGAGLPGAVENGIDPERLSFVAGALCQGAAAVHLPEGEDAIRRDAVILRGVAAPDSAEAAEAAEVDEVAELFDAFRRRTLLRLHTLNPDVDDIEGWMDRLFEGEARDGTLRRRYAEAYCSLDDVPDPSLYDPSDPVVELARALARGDEPGDDVASAVAATGTSRYARALEDGYQNLAAASRFLRGGIVRVGLDAQLTL